MFKFQNFDRRYHWDMKFPQSVIWVVFNVSVCTLMAYKYMPILSLKVYKLTNCEIANLVMKFLGGFNSEEKQLKLFSVTFFQNSNYIQE